MRPDARIPNNSSGKPLAVGTLFLLFLAIAAYGGEHVWHEAWLLGGVFFTSSAIFITKPDAVRHLPGRLFLPLVLLSAYSFVQGIVPLLTAGGFIDHLAFLPFGFDATASLWNGVKILGFACLLGLCLISVRSRRELFVNGLILIGGIFAAFGIARLLLQYVVPQLNRYFFAYELGPNIGFGTFVNQNHFALLMLMTLGISLGPLFERACPTRKKVLPLIVGLTSWIALILTASRAGIIGSFLVVGARIAFYIASVVARHRVHDQRGRKLSLTLLKWGAGSILILAAMIAGVIFVGQGRVLQRFAELPEQIEGTSGVGFRRPDVWEATSRIIQEHYLFGTGFGGFRYAVSQVIDIAGDIVPQQAHNDYLEFVASGGIISAALFVWFAWMMFREMSRSRALSSTKGISAASIGAVCGIVGVAFHSLADFGLQYVGNMGFFIALISVAASPARARGDARQLSFSPFERFQNLAAIILGLGLCGICAVFGISRYSLIDRGNDVRSRPAIRIPFDAEYYAASAGRAIRTGDNEAAVEGLRNATRLRDHDYSLWLKLAPLEARAGNEDAAEASYRNAISLAPLYGEPHFYYGLFLVERSRNVEAMNELVFSARRDQRFLNAVLETMWGRSTYVPDYLQYLIEGGRYDTNAGIMRFLIGKQEYELIADLSCRVELSDMERDVLIRQLLERRSVRTAWKIYRHECQKVNESSSLIDGDFEMSEVRKGAGFGWLIGDELKRSNIGIDRDNKARGQQSLKFTFDGEVRSFFLKQTIPVRKNARYKLSFSYRSNAIISGGAPVVQIVTQQAEGTGEVQEAELLPDQVQWAQKTLSFETNDKTEAIDVILTKRACYDPKCPIFGELWVDNFEIIELSSPIR